MAKRKGSKSAQIREHLTANPDATATAVAKTFKVSPALVYGVKRRMNGKATKKRATGRKRTKATRSSRNGAVAAASQEPLIQAARLIKTCGSVEVAQAALKTAGLIANTLD